MRKLFFLTTICMLSWIGVQQRAWAQKQSKVERLYEYISKSETEKYDKAKAKMDPKSAETYQKEIALADAFYHLFFNPGMPAVEPYLKSSQEVYREDDGTKLQNIFKAVNLSVPAFVGRADSLIYKVLADSKEQLKDSRTLLQLIAKYQYKINPDVYNSIILTKEKVQFQDLKALPTQEKCETYVADFGNKYNYQAVAKIYNDLLFDQVRSKKDEASVLAYFNNDILKTFYADTKEKRTHQEEVQRIYDGLIYQEIKQAKTPELLKEKIQKYQNSPYLTDDVRSYTALVEYKNDSIDYEILVHQVDSSAKLPMIKNYLQSHKYREFIDKARALREKFVANTIWSNPSSMKFYTGNKIAKENIIVKDTVTTINYNYNDHGYLLGVEKKIEVKGAAPVLINTTYKYNDLGKCYEEETVNAASKKVICQVTYQYNASGNISMKNTKWDDNRSCTENYNAQGQLVQVQEYENGQIRSQTDYIYNKNGQLAQKIWTNLKPGIDQPVTKQVSDYQYNNYGFPSGVSYVKETLQNEKITGNTKFCYDEFWNVVDPNCKYEYDQTGAWIVKMNKMNPEDVEKFEYTYK